MSRNFSPEFKTEAASKVLDEGMSIRIACETFGVGDTAMRRWVKQLAEERTGEVPQGDSPSEDVHRSEGDGNAWSHLAYYFRWMVVPTDGLGTQNPA